MLLKLNNIGKISHAEISLDGLTVIAGVNDSGKSTVGKALYSLVNAYNTTENYTEERRKLQLSKVVDAFYQKYSDIVDHLTMPATADTFMHLCESDEDTAAKWLVNSLNHTVSLDNTPRNVSMIRREIHDIIGLIEKKDKDKFFRDTLRQRIFSEFKDKFQRIGTDSGDLYLTENNATVGLEMQCFNDGEYSIVKDNALSMFTDVTYIESPLFMREYPAYFVNREATARYGRQTDHLIDFIHKLDGFNSVSGNVTNADNEWVSDYAETLTKISRGHFLRNEHSEALKWCDNLGNEFNPLNVASGIKSLGVLQMLMQAGYVDTNKLLIWDEPENHLHPEWQIKLAGILVQLVSLGVPVLINSHSPYFIQAIRFNASRTGVEKYVRYYLSEDNADNSVRLDEVTDDLNRLFYKLAEPLNSIMDL